MAFIRACCFSVRVCSINQHSDFGVTSLKRVTRLAQPRCQSRWWRPAAAGHPRHMTLTLSVFQTETDSESRNSDQNRSNRMLLNFNDIKIQDMISHVSRDVPRCVPQANHGVNLLSQIFLAAALTCFAHSTGSIFGGVLSFSMTGFMNSKISSSIPSL